MAPIDLLHRLKKFYTKEAVGEAPAILPRSAAALSVLFTLIYVVPFYLSATTRPSPHLSRDAPSVIRTRIRAVTTSCFVCTLLTIVILVRSAHAGPIELFRLLGWWPVSVLDCAKTLLLVAVLFAGPLFENGVVDGGWRDWVRGRYVGEVLSGWIGWRNYVAGPVTEELIWRSLIIPIHLEARVSPVTIIFVTPLYFGIAHLHHYYEFRLTHPHTAALPAVLRSVFQFSYTSLFGFFAAFVFLRTNSLWAAVLAHSFCNWMGLPRVWGRVGVEAGAAVGLPEGGKKGDGEKLGDRWPKGPAPAGLGIGWTVAYYVLLVSGAIGFYHCLWPLTESPLGLEALRRSPT